MNEIFHPQLGNAKFKKLENAIFLQIDLIKQNRSKDIL